MLANAWNVPIMTGNVCLGGNEIHCHKHACGGYSDLRYDTWII